jgi:hypothetical protein
MELWKAFVYWNNRGYSDMEEYMAEHFNPTTLRSFYNFAIDLKKSTEKLLNEYNENK